MFLAKVLKVVVVAGTPVVLVELKAAASVVEAGEVVLVVVHPAVVDALGVETTVVLWVEKVVTVVETPNCFVALLKLFGSFGRVKPGSLGSSISSNLFIKIQEHCRASPTRSVFWTWVPEKVHQSTRWIVCLIVLLWTSAIG